MATSRPANHNIKRNLGLVSPYIKVFNDSGKYSKVIISSTPTKFVNDVGIQKLGNVGMSILGDLKEQERTIDNGEMIKFELDNYSIYCSAFFDIDGEWVEGFKNIKWDSSKSDIYLREKHVLKAIKNKNIKEHNNN